MNTLKLIPLFMILLTLSCSDYQNDLQAPGPRPADGGEGTLSVKNPFTPQMLNPNSKAFSEQNMLLNIGANVIVKNVHEFALQAELLQSRADSYCSDLDDGVDATLSEQNFKNQWKAAMLAFHSANAAPVGPASDNNHRLSDNIYSWPLISTCGIDEAVGKVSAGGAYGDTDLVNVKGLGAIEYLLFETTLVPKCNAVLNKDAVAWGKKPLEQKKKDRCHYAQFLVKDVIVKARELDADWDVDRGNFTKTLVDGSRYPNIRQAVNALTDSMYTIEKVKEQELSQPLGLSSECKSAGKHCPEMAEHQWSGIAVEAIQAQLSALKTIFLGAASATQKAYGLDDYLAAKGHPEIGEQLGDNLQEALTRSNALTAASLQTQIASFDTGECATAEKNVSVDLGTLPALCSFYLNVRNADNLFTGDLMVILALAAPVGFQGDND